MIAPKAIALSLLLKKSLALSLWLSKDPVRDSIQGKIDHFSHLSSWSVAIVAVGVVLELIEVIHDSVAWIRRKRREGRERAEWESLSTVFPVGKMKAEKESHIDHPKWVKHCLRFGIIAVALGVIGEYEYGTKLEDAHNAMHEYDVRKLTEADQKAGEAATSAKIAHEEADAVKGIADEGRADAKDALEKSQAAQRELAHAEADAAKAQTVASKALSTADKSESHLAEAVKRAEILAAKLERLTTPRRLPHSAQVTDLLKAFTGTEYVFVGTCGDQECFDLVLDINELLKLAGWKRVKGLPMRIGIRQFIINGDKDFKVDESVSTGIGVSVETPNGFESIKDIPPDQVPGHIRAAIALNQALASSVSPSENTGRQVGVG